MTGSSIFRIALWAMVALLAGAAVSLYLFSRPAEPGESEAPYGTPFELVDQNGDPITEEAMRGEPSAVFFGFTHCPDVCPTTLYELAGYQKTLAEQGEELNVFFVTVDPARDTPEVLKDYVEAVSDDVTAITGNPDEIAAMLEGWGIYAKKVGEGEDYTMDHTASVLLLDENGNFEGTIAFGENPETARQKLERLVTS